ncbi:aldose epimerase family protein [Mucilaginibacter gotjawali]|uniref:Aldose 1-epimerase n=1 Tax=Mucilaginibacter gotjawali TaxID=1550579 RepID=A0A839SIH4_9SPHI|nr:aldose epimerase family protein [Mucilaginibacter gotjawali]MBB3057646.1 aldose 1-epimerase [Mucilaginibacter gotjawali]
MEGKETALFKLKNTNGMEVLITNYGGCVVGLFLPDKNGVLTDVVIGLGSIDSYRHSTQPRFGAIIGGYGNRMANGAFNIKDEEYTLCKNNGPNALHGGKKGFRDVVWDVIYVDNSRIELYYFSEHMEEGFPGNLKVKLVYSLTEDNSLKINYAATTDKPIVVNLTHSTFFNLNGEGSGTIFNHQVQIKADNYLPVDSTLTPTGNIEDVTGTPFDFRKAATIGSRINDHSGQLKNGKGFDHNFVLNKHAMHTPVARVKGDKSGIVMEVFTDQPGLQFYSGNFMRGKNILKGGGKDGYRTAFSMETQHFPDPPNKPLLTSTLLSRGKEYKAQTIYRFIADSV